MSLWSSPTKQSTVASVAFRSSSLIDSVIILLLSVSRSSSLLGLPSEQATMPRAMAEAARQATTRVTKRGMILLGERTIRPYKGTTLAIRMAHPISSALPN